MIVSSITRIIRVGMAIPFIVSGFAVVPEALKFGHLAVNLAEPVIVSEYRLSSFTPEDYEREIKAALLVKDPAGAKDIVDLALAQKISIAPDLEAEVAEANKFHMLTTIGDCTNGLILGIDNSTTEIACSFIGDLTAIGDARVLMDEIQKYPDSDLLNVGFAVVGIALTVATIRSGGTSASVKVGLLFLKAAKKSGKLASGIIIDLEKLIARSIDNKAIADLVVAAKKFDLSEISAKAGKLINPKAINELSEVAGDVQKISGPNSYRVALGTLGASDSIADVKKWRLVAEKLGKKFPGALKMLKSSGKLVLKIGEILGKLLFWMVTLLVWFVGMIVSSIISIWSMISFFRLFRSRRSDAGLTGA